MSLILAVEPDRRQAKELTSLVRRHLKAEILIAETGAAALEALDGRVPDLILTPALLPPRDEAVLTGWLRDLGDDAGHVQTLAIPILAAPESRTRENSGIFGRLRDQPSSDSGCDPSVFADQMKVYLERAAGERPARMAQVSAPAPPPLVAVAPQEEEEESIELDEILSLDDLVIEGPSFDRAPATEPPPPVAPPARSVAPPPPVAPPVRSVAPPAPPIAPAVRSVAPAPPVAPPVRSVAPAPPVDAHVLREWEAELGLNAAPETAPPLWRVGDHHEDVDRTAVHLDASTAATPGTWGAFDLAQPHIAALLRRLDEVAAGTPGA